MLTKFLSTYILINNHSTDIFQCFYTNTICINCIFLKSEGREEGGGRVENNIIYHQRYNNFNGKQGNNFIRNWYMWFSDLYILLILLIQILCIRQWVGERKKMHNFKFWFWNMWYQSMLYYTNYTTVNVSLIYLLLKP